MTVTTERLELVPLTLADAQAVLEGRAGPQAWAAGFPTEGDVVVASLIAASDADPPPPWCPYRVVVHSSGVVVGGAGFLHPPHDGEVEIGYGIASSVRGRGYATEAVRALCAVAAREGARVVAATAPGNLASQSVLARAGFTPAGERDSELLFAWSAP